MRAGGRPQEAQGKNGRQYTEARNSRTGEEPFPSGRPPASILTEKAGRPAVRAPGAGGPLGPAAAISLLGAWWHVSDCVTFSCSRL